MNRVSTFFGVVVLFSSFATPAFADMVNPVGLCARIPSTIGIGAKDSKISNSVLLLQDYLTHAGYLTAVTPAGSFERNTRAAVQTFQTHEGIPATGVVGPLTRARIEQRSCTASGTLSFVAINATSKVLPGAKATWVLEMTLPEAASTTVQYLADWGDGQTSTKPDVIGANPAAPTWLVVFTHSFKNQGSYQPTFTITGATSSTPVRVVSPITVSNTSVLLNVHH